MSRRPPNKNHGTSSYNGRDAWGKFRLGDICEIVRGVSYKKNQASEQPEKGKVPILRATNIQESTLVLDSDLVYVPSTVVSEEQMLQVGDIIVATSSGSKHLVGKTAQVKQVWEGSFGTFCATLRPKVDIDHRYLGYFFGTQEYKDYISKKALGVNINNLRRGDLEEIIVPVAPPEQQKLIVAENEKQFSRLDEAVANLKRIKANLKRYKAAVLKAAVEGKLTEEWRRTHPNVESASKLLERILTERGTQKMNKDEKKHIELTKKITSGELEELPSLPPKWAYIRLGALINEPKYGTSKKCDYKTEGIGVLRIPNVINGFIDINDLKFAKFDKNDLKTYKLKEGDILLIRSNGSVSLVGKCARVRKLDEKFLYAGYLIRIRPLSEFILSKYLMICFPSLLLRKQIEAKAKSTSGVNNINSGELQSLIFPVCSKEEQNVILNEVERRLSVIEEFEATVETNLTRSNRLRQSILQDAFRGTLV